MPKFITHTSAKLEDLQKLQPRSLLEVLNYQFHVDEIEECIVINENLSYFILKKI